MYGAVAQMRRERGLSVRQACRELAKHPPTIDGARMVYSAPTWRGRYLEVRRFMEPYCIAERFAARLEAEQRTVELFKQRHRII
jgi:hypothetical protein